MPTMQLRNMRLSTIGSSVALALMLAAPFPVSAVVCTDPASLGQIISQTYNDAALWFQEKAQRLWEMDMSKMMSSWSNDQEAMREMAATQKQTEAVSETANREMASNYEPQNVCGTFESAMAMVSAFEKGLCEEAGEQLDFVDEQVYTCKRGGNCRNEAASKLRDEVAGIVDSAVSDSGTVNAEKMNVADAITNNAESGYTIPADKADKMGALLKNMVGAGNLGPMPSNPDGTPFDENSSDADKRALANWMRKAGREQAVFATMNRVTQLRMPGKTPSGETARSLLEVINQQVLEYNSPDYLLKIGNGHSKEDIAKKAATFKTQAEADAFWASPEGMEMRSKVTNDAQVIRMIAEMTAFQQRIAFMQLESQIGAEFHAALQTQILSERAR